MIDREEPPVKRIVIYDVEQRKPEVKSGNSDNQRKKDPVAAERRQRALRTIHNASTLSKIVESIESLKLTDPSKDGPVIKEAIDKISTIVEEMKLEFKKDYWE